MAGENHPGMQSGPPNRADFGRDGVKCAEVEALLAEVLDGTLQGEQLIGFEAHQQSCASCRGMVEEARAGMHWLKGLDEAEPPVHLVLNILAQTIGALPSEHAVVAPRGEGWFEKLKARLAPVFAPVATPRFAMSFGMAFFSITMLLGIAGFHMSDLRHLDLSSKGIMKTYYDSEARIIRYYENMRLVYEIESRVRDLKRAATPENNSDNKQQPQPQQQQQQKQEAPATKNPSKSENRQEQDQSTPTYSRDNSQPELVVFPAEQTSAASVRDLIGGAFGRAAAVPFPSELASASANGEFVLQARLNRRTV
jgi:hypothetical protein